MKKLKLELTEQEAKLVLEAIIFFSSVDVISTVEEEEAEKLYNTIEKLYKTLKLKPKQLNVSVYGNQKTFEQKQFSIKLKRLLKSC